VLLGGIAVNLLITIGLTVMAVCWKIKLRRLRTKQQKCIEKIKVDKLARIKKSKTENFKGK